MIVNCTMVMMTVSAILLLALISLSEALFKCPDDGHWPNPESCASYFHCANGRPYEGNCPAGLLWNGIKQECDFPENVNCDISIGEAAKFKVDYKKEFSSCIANIIACFRSKKDPTST